MLLQKRNIVIVLFVIMLMPVFAQKNARKILSFNDDLSSYPINPEKYSTKGKISHKQKDNNTGYDITDDPDPEAPGIRIVTPAIDERDTEDSTCRISGCTMPGADVRVKNNSVQVYSTGGFMEMIHLFPGQNIIPISATLNGKTSSTVIVINKKGREVFTQSPKYPPVIDPDFINEPGYLYLSEGESFEFFMKGTSGAKAWIEIGKTKKKINLAELNENDLSNKWGIKGIYSGKYKAGSGTQFKDQVLKYGLQINDKNTTAVLFSSKMIMSVSPDSKPLIGEINTKEGAAKLTDDKANRSHIFIDNGIRFAISKIADGKVKIRTNCEEKFSISVNDLKIVNISEKEPVVEIKKPVKVSEDSDYVTWSVAVSEKIPYSIKLLQDPSKIGIAFFGNKMKSGTIKSKKGEVKSRFWNYYFPGFQFDCAGGFNWGMSTRYEGNNLIVKIRKAPPLNSVNLFKGLRICIDPGHGGIISGAVGCIGLEEKEANFSISEHLKQMLEQAGAEVKMTMESDSDIALYERVGVARNYNAHIFISMHNNSVGVDERGDNASGALVFYTHPSGKALAEEIGDEFKNLPIPVRGVRWANFQVTRPYDMPSVLIEGCFISNPFEERMLASDNFRKEIAQCAFDGIKDFLKKRSRHK